MLKALINHTIHCVEKLIRKIKGQNSSYKGLEFKL